MPTGHAADAPREAAAARTRAAPATAAASSSGPRPPPAEIHEPALASASYTNASTSASRSAGGSSTRSRSAVTSSRERGMPSSVKLPDRGTHLVDAVVLGGVQVQHHPPSPSASRRNVARGFWRIVVRRFDHRRSSLSSWRVSPVLCDQYRPSVPRRRSRCEGAPEGEDAEGQRDDRTGIRTRPPAGSPPIPHPPSISASRLALQRDRHGAELERAPAPTGAAHRGKYAAGTDRDDRGERCRRHRCPA